jgi:hypothetical protein
MSSVISSSDLNSLMSMDREPLNQQLFGDLTTTSYVSLSPQTSPKYGCSPKSSPKKKNSLKNFVTITDNCDLLSLEPNDNYFQTDLDLFSSFADSVDTPQPFPLKSSRDGRRVSPIKLKSLENSLPPQKVSLRSVILPQEESVTLPARPLSRVSSVTMKKRAQSEKSLLLSSTHTLSEGLVDRSMSIHHLSLFEDPNNDPNNNKSTADGTTTTLPQLQHLPRQPIFRAIRGKRLSNNPYTDTNNTNSTIDLFNSSILRQQQQQQNSSSRPHSRGQSGGGGGPVTAHSVQSSTLNVSHATDDSESEVTVEGPGEEDGMKLDNPSDDEQQPLGSPDIRLGGELDASQVLAPNKNKKKHNRKNNKEQDNNHEGTGPMAAMTSPASISLYRPSTGALQRTGGGPTGSQSLDPLPYQVHGRILGWKLTSVQRRKELVDVLDMMKEQAAVAAAGGQTTMKPSLTNKNGAGGIKQTFSSMFTAEDFLKDMAADQQQMAASFEEQQQQNYYHNNNYNNNSHHIDDKPAPKLTLREAEAWQTYVTRNLKSRQNYKSAKQIRQLMDEKRKTEKLTEISTQRFELLRNKNVLSHKQVSRDILNEKSTDDYLSFKNSELLEELNIPPPSRGFSRGSVGGPSMATMGNNNNNNNRSGAAAYLSSSLDLSKTTRNQQSQLSIPKHPQSQRNNNNHHNNKKNAVQKLYNFPTGLYKPRDRSEIFDSIQIRHRLEGPLTREKERQKERLVDKFVEDGLGLGIGRSFLDMYDTGDHDDDDRSDFITLEESLFGKPADDYQRTTTGAAGDQEEHSMRDDPIDLDLGETKFGKSLELEPEERVMTAAEEQEMMLLDDEQILTDDFINDDDESFQA